MIRLTSVVLVILGVIGGALSDSAESNPESKRTRYEVVEADFHVHSHAGDGMLSPFGLVLLAQQKGLKALAITDHNQIFGAKAGRWFSRLIGGPTVLVGEEITAPGFHLIAVGIDRRITWRQSASEAIEEIHRQGGIAIAAHPGSKYEQAFGPVLQELDGSEVMHPLAYSSSERGREMQDFYRRASAGSHVVTALGSSDYHWFNSLGICRTYVFVLSNDQSGILEALRAGRTVVYDLEGNAYGNPELIELLQDQPIKRGVGDYHYGGRGVIDIVTRTLGWLGLIGLVLFAKKNPVSQ
jgi:hypothetical protein